MASQRKTTAVAELVKFVHWAKRKIETDKLDLFRQICRQFSGDKGILIRLLMKEEYAEYENVEQLGKSGAESEGYEPNGWLGCFVNWTSFGWDYYDEYKNRIFKLDNGNFVEFFNLC